MSKMNEIIFEIITYFPFSIGKKLRKVFIKNFSNSCGFNLNLNIHYGVLIKTPKNISFGNNVDIGQFSYIDSEDKISIGSNVMISSNVYITTQTHTYLRRDIPIQKQESSKNPLVIEDDVWIGHGAVINSGSRPLKISKGVIIGSNAVVVKDCDTPYGIYAGVPAKLIKMR